MECITAGVGLMRMPDLYTRAHAASILDSMGAGLIFFGLALQAPNYLIAVKLLFTFFFLMPSRKQPSVPVFQLFSYLQRWLSLAVPVSRKVQPEPYSRCSR